jgi:hypothetical protein
MVMLIAGLIYGSDLNTGGTIQFQTRENVTVNQQSGGLNVSPINLGSLLAIGVIISVAIALVLVMAVHVLGSGISGSVIPIVFLVTILTGVYTILSGISFPLFNSIPIFGLPIYFGLIVMYIIGIASLASGSGGD